MDQIKKFTMLVLVVFLFMGFGEKKRDEPATLKVMTYNIWNGFEWGKDSLRREQCIQWIKKQQPDVLALQEMCGYDEAKLRKDALKWGHKYVQLLKEDGYPTALTSNQPIILKEKKTDSLWHGLLHCETYGIDFYVVHLSPADVAFRHREAKLITKRIKNGTNDKYVVLGDFNSHSPIDAQVLEKNLSLKEKYRASKNKNNYSNLRNGEFDYSVISEFFACPTKDVALTKVDVLKTGHTFPTSALIGKYSNTKQSILQNRQRIDYILASPVLANSCSTVEIFNQGETHGLSDHYPMMAIFGL